MTEAELVLQAQGGDQAAFGLLVERHAPMIRRLTRTILRHEEDADDAAQDAFLSAWNALSRFDPRLPLGPWLGRIAMNAARDLRRRRRVRVTEAVSPTLAAAGAGPDTETERSLLRARLQEALTTLPERQRVAVVLFEVEGYSHAEIGSMLGIPEGTARSDVFHARRRLRIALGTKEGTDDEQSI